MTDGDQNKLLKLLKQTVKRRFDFAMEAIVKASVKVSLVRLLKL